ncbi:MAG TPA: DivIVA domain-containing protein [Candidatus Krumholzibacteria bacterium]|nr:DivIVA domain-containing protein [Candidatus Krumholzibacteria bacterium]
MRITPLDVRKQEFRKVMRGLDADEVYAFLATVADEYEAVLNDNRALRERVLELDDKVQEYRSIERTLRDTLLTAERVTVESKDNARREANIIVKEAQLEAEKALRDITGEAARLRQEVQRLRSQRDAYLAKMKVVAESHVKFIEAAERDTRSEDGGAHDEPRPATARPVLSAVPESPKPRPASLFSSPAPAPPAGEGDGESIDGLGDILDRLSQSQRDMLAGEANERPAPQPATPPAAPAAPGRPAAEPAESEWNIEQIRRDLQRLAAVPRPPEGPNA